MTLDEFKKIVKWNPKYTGKGLRIAITELGLGYDFDKYYDENINATKYISSDKNKMERINGHTNSVGYILRELFPDAKIFLLDSQKDETYEWIANNNIHIVNMSISNTMASVYKASKTSYLVTSAGNNGDSGESMRKSQSKYWFEVGALDVNNEKFELMDYSSWSYDRVDGAMLSGIETPYGIFHGTSCSSPLYVGVLGQYYQAHNEFFNVYPSINQTLDFIDRHSHNVLLFDDDADLKIGYGLLVLPEKYHFEEVIFKFEEGSNESYTTVLRKSDGGTSTNKLIEPAFIKDGRTYLGLRDMANIKGNFIDWYDDTREVKIYIQQGDH